MAAVGVHFILELFQCPAEKLDDPSSVDEALRNAARLARSTLLNQVSHRFEPQGVTSIGLLAESHISIHTWPEHGYVAADIFTCGETAQPEAACRFLVEFFEARSHSMRRIRRGASASSKDDQAACAQESDEERPWQAPRYARISG